jgi:hypothetical protein
MATAQAGGAGAGDEGPEGERWKRNTQIHWLMLEHHSCKSKKKH